MPSGAGCPIGESVPNAVEVLEVFWMKDFLTEAECDALVDLIGARSALKRGFLTLPPFVATQAHQQREEIP